MRSFLKSKLANYCLIILIILGVFLRFYGLNWDQGYHLHPDERMISMVVMGLHLPQISEEWQNIFTPKSPLNPKFFAYGSFPFYFLRFSGWLLSYVNPHWLGYDRINLLGRAISGIADTGVILLIYLLGRRVWSKKIGVLASFFYAFSVLPIQLAHFYAVDSLLNLFILLTLYRLVLFYEKPKFRNALLVGFSFGLSLATKISATVLLVAISTTLIIDLILIFLKRVRHVRICPRIHQELFKFASWIVSAFRTPKKERFLIIFFSILKYGVIIGLVSFITFLIFEPYALIDSITFWQQTKQQQAMTKDAFVFPYTLQFVGTLPYLYYLKNLILWGMGIPLGIFSLLAVLYLSLHLIKEVPRPGRENQEAKIIILFSFFLVYFLVVGRFAVKFMRYLLPLYPLLCLFSAWFFLNIIKSSKKIISLLGKASLIVTLIVTVLWALAFSSIYSRPHSRVTASEWINQNITAGSRLANEHWDDGLPLFNGGKYVSLEMPMYGSDMDEKKWAQVNQNLKEADYLILSSNRLYLPLQRLTDCSKYPPWRCYPKTAQYYKDLFSGKLGFTKVAEFTSFPGFRLGKFRLEIDDTYADENFTVFDHPKVIIFSRIN